jgi:hypothetical protein
VLNSEFNHHDESLYERNHDCYVGGQKNTILAEIEHGTEDAQERPAELHQFLVVASLTANSQETMLKPAARQVLISADFAM